MYIDDWRKLMREMQKKTTPKQYGMYLQTKKRGRKK